MRLFLQTTQERDIEVIQVEETATVEQVLTEHVQIEEADLWLEGADEPLARHLTLIEAEITADARVHGGRCKKVTVEVNYNADTKTHEFPPATTVEHAYRYFVGEHGFNLAPPERAKHHLVLCGTKKAPDVAAHLGALATDCKLCFDLVPTHRHEG